MSRRSSSRSRSTGAVPSDAAGSSRPMSRIPTTIPGKYFVRRVVVVAVDISRDQCLLSYNERVTSVVWEVFYFCLAVVD